MFQRDKSVRGQSLVEFALVLPVFLLLLIGIAEFGRAWMTRNILTGASREAVRIAAVQGNTASALSRANNILSSAGISGASVNIADDGAPHGTCSAPVARLGAYRFLSEKNQMAESAKLQTVGVAVAVVDIPLGTTINSNQVGVSMWPKNLYPKDAFTTAAPPP